MDNFDNYSIDIDAECLHQDFDDVDLYGEKIEENETDMLSESIDFGN